MVFSERIMWRENLPALKHPLDKRIAPLEPKKIQIVGELDTVTVNPSTRFAPPGRQLELGVSGDVDLYWPCTTSCIDQHSFSHLKIIPPLPLITTPWRVANMWFMISIASTAYLRTFLGAKNMYHQRWSFRRACLMSNSWSWDPKASPKLPSSHPQSSRVIYSSSILLLEKGSRK